MENDSRTIEQLRNHFEVERELGQRLLKTPRGERAELFRTMYDELFERVPDHPRLTRRDTEEECARAVAARMSLLRGQLEGVKTFVEIAPGDCRLAYEVCQSVDNVIGVDISNQSGDEGDAEAPDNFQLFVYDGYTLDLPEDSADMAFSYQFLEHLHPEDVPLHFELVQRILRPGGKYIFSTPHRFSGPHDVSRHFSETPEGFHLKEWTHRELVPVIKAAGFRKAHTYRLGKARRSALANAATVGLELGFQCLPRRLRKKLSLRIFQGVTMILEK
ncbi:MAG: class I SAM-dependent methyltransferase [Verrucomicrobiia bacterium]|jgi:SAM-dependent methyltransferase